MVRAAEVARLLALLAQTRRSSALAALRGANALSRCLGALLATPWSSILHSALRAVILEVIANEDDGFAAVVAMIKDVEVMRQVVQEHRAAVEARNAIAAAAAAEEGEERQEPGFSPVEDVGYLGPLHSICAELYELGSRVPEVASALAAVEGWDEVVVPEILAMQTLQAEPLGGPTPDVAGPTSPLCNFDCMEAMRMAMGELNDEMDLSLEDLRDINEEFDMAQMVEMADLHSRRRAKAAARAGVRGEDPLMDDDEDDEETAREASAVSRPDAPSPEGGDEDVS